MRSFVRRAAVVGTLTSAMIGQCLAVAHADDVVITGPSEVVVNQAYENVPWAISGVTFSEDRYEYCSIELENTRTRLQAASDMPNEYEYSGMLEAQAYSVAAAGAGSYVLRADCYWAGIAEVPVSIKFGSKTKLTKVTRTANQVTVTGTVKRFESAFEAWKGARVRLEKQDGTKWVKVRTVRTDRDGKLRIVADLPQRTKVRLVALETADIVGSISRVG